MSSPYGKFEFNGKVYGWVGVDFDHPFDCTATYSVSLHRPNGELQVWRYWGRKDARKQHKRLIRRLKEGWRVVVHSPSGFEAPA